MSRNGLLIKTGSVNQTDPSAGGLEFTQAEPICVELPPRLTRVVLNATGVTLDEISGIERCVIDQNAFVTIDSNHLIKVCRQTFVPVDVGPREQRVVNMRKDGIARKTNLAKNLSLSDMVADFDPQTSESHMRKDAELTVAMVDEHKISNRQA